MFKVALTAWARVLSQGTQHLMRCLRFLSFFFRQLLFGLVKLAQRQVQVHGHAHGEQTGGTAAPGSNSNSKVQLKQQPIWMDQINLWPGPSLSTSVLRKPVEKRID